MKNKTFFLMLVSGLFLIGTGSCSNEKGSSSDNDGLAMDSASMANRAKDELTLSILKNIKVAAEQNANEAASDANEAKRIERDATDAAEEADDAFRTEEKRKSHVRKQMTRQKNRRTPVVRQIKTKSGND